jgi:Bacterial lipid A biosynthesis acyltransferase
VARVTGATAADRLAAVDVPTSHLFPVREGRLRQALHARPRVRRTLGLRRAVRLARLRGRAEWRLRPGPRRAAIARARALLGPGADPGAVRALARDHLLEGTMQGELTWHPWAAARMPVRGLERLEASRAGGRGAILAGAHVGPMHNLMHALAARGHAPYVVTLRRPDRPLPPGPAGRWIRMQHLLVERAGCRWVRLGEPCTYEVLRALLERGELCWLNWDVPGELAVPLLGGTARVRTGIARLALETGARVVPGLAWREGDGHAADLLGALDPAVHADERALMEALVSDVEPALRTRLAQVQPFFTACLGGPGA